MKIKATEILGSVLKDGIDVHRCAAARALGAIAAPQAADMLTGALMDEDPDVRVDAATALAGIRSPATADKLMENLLGDPEADVKLAAISALVAMKHTPIVPLLRALVVSRAEDQVVWDEEEFYTEGWDSWTDVQLAALDGLAAFAPEDAVADILAALGDEMGQDVSEPAFRALARMGASGARALTIMFESGEARICRRIARAVGQSDNPGLNDLRRKMLSNDVAAIRALALVDLDPTDAGLPALFDDPDASVRAAAVRHAGVENLSKLHDMIADPAPQVRTEVFRVITANPAAFSDDKDVEAVKTAISGDPQAARQAALALFALKGPSVAKGFSHVLGKQDVPRDFRIGVLETLEKAGQTAVPALLGAAGDPDRQLRLASLTTLAEIAANDAAWPNDAGLGLLAALRGELVQPPEEEVEEEPAVQAESAPAPDRAELDDIAEEIDQSLPLVAEDAAPGSTLRAIMSNEPQQPVEEPEEIVLDNEQERLLANTNTRKFSRRKVSWQTAVAPYLDVRRFSARLLGRVLNPAVTDALIATLEQDIDDETRDGVLFSLSLHGAQTGTLPETLREKAENLLNSANSETRVLATRLLGFMAGDDITAKLETLTGHGDELVRVEAILALDRRDVVGAGTFAALNDSYLGAGIAAARSLARLRGDEAVDDLLEFAMRNDGTYRRDVGQLLGQYAPRVGAERLIGLLKDETRKIYWLVAIDALAELFQHEQPADTRLVA